MAVIYKKYVLSFTQYKWQHSKDIHKTLQTIPFTISPCIIYKYKSCFHLELKDNMLADNQAHYRNLAGHKTHHNMI